jgi:hypothetical protein
MLGVLYGFDDDDEFVDVTREPRRVDPLSRKGSRQQNAPTPATDVGTVQVKAPCREAA